MEKPGDSHIYLSLTIVSAPPTDWTDSSATLDGAGYTYHIRALRGIEKSLWSNSATAQVGQPNPATEPEFDYLTLNPPETDIVVSNTGKNPNEQVGLGVIITARAQSFQAGTATNLYRLNSIGIQFNQIGDPSLAGDELLATLETANGNQPGSTLCNLENPATFVANAVNTFSAPDGENSCPPLENGTKYFVLLDRADQQAGVIELDATNDKGENPDRAAGWHISNSRSYFANGSWSVHSTNVHMIEVNAVGNKEASGDLIISGTPTLGEVFTADISGIKDGDGIDPTKVAYQWRRDSSDVSGATSDTYTVTRGDLNARLGVQVTFTDLDGFPEGPFDSPPVSILMPNHLLVHNTQQGLLSFNATLNTVSEKRAQGFSTGPASGKFTLSSVAIRINEVDDGFPIFDLRATVNVNSGGNPGASLCTLSNPTSIKADHLAYFRASGDDCPEFAQNTTYFFVLERITGSKSIGLRVTSSTGEGIGGAPTWSISNERHHHSGGSWSSPDNEAYLIFITGYHPDQDEIEEDGNSVSGPPPPAGFLVSNTGQTSHGLNAKLEADTTKRAQAFTAGSYAPDGHQSYYSLHSVGVKFNEIADSAPETRLTATINARGDGGNPGKVLCTMWGPAKYTADSANTYRVSAEGCVLKGGKIHFFVLERTDTSGNIIGLHVTSSKNEDSSAAAGW